MGFNKGEYYRGKMDAEMASFRNPGPTKMEVVEFTPEPWIQDVFAEYPDAYGIAEMGSQKVIVLQYKVGRTGKKAEILRLRDDHRVVSQKSEEVPIDQLEIIAWKKHYDQASAEDVEEGLVA